MEMGRSVREEMAVAVNQTQPTEEGIQTAGLSDTLSFAFCWPLFYVSAIITMFITHWPEQFV